MIKIIQLLKKCITSSFLKIFCLINTGWFRNLLCPDPQGQKNMDPDGSGSETLLFGVIKINIMLLM